MSEKTIKQISREDGWFVTGHSVLNFKDIQSIIMTTNARYNTYDIVFKNGSIYKNYEAVGLLAAYKEFLGMVELEQ